MAPLAGGQLGGELAGEGRDDRVELGGLGLAGEQEVLALQRVPHAVAGDAVASADLGVAPRGLGLDAAAEGADPSPDLVAVVAVAQLLGAPCAALATTSTAGGAVAAGPRPARALPGPARDIAGVPGPLQRSGYGRLRGQPFDGLVGRPATARRLVGQPTELPQGAGALFYMQLGRFACEGPFPVVEHAGPHAYGQEEVQPRLERFDRLPQADIGAKVEMPLRNTDAAVVGHFPEGASGFQRIAPPEGENGGERLTVSLWLARDQRQAAARPETPAREVGS